MPLICITYVDYNMVSAEYRKSTLQSSFKVMHRKIPLHYVLWEMCIFGSFQWFTSNVINNYRSLWCTYNTFFTDYRGHKIYETIEFMDYNQWLLEARFHFLYVILNLTFSILSNLQKVYRSRTRLNERIRTYKQISTTIAENLFLLCYVFSELFI